VGAETVALVARRHGASLRREKGTRSRTAQLDMGAGRVVLAVPETYMNESGMALSALVRRYRVEDVSDLVVVHDELDLPSGRVKIKRGGGTAGHNGLESVSSHLHSGSYVRVRIGIGKPPGRQTGAQYVLRRPGRAEREVLETAVEVAADAVETIVGDGVDAAMQKFNTDPVT
jgi:peptidyl-tRNA hydrolase, PTH1 family